MEPIEWKKECPREEGIFFVRAHDTGAYGVGVVFDSGESCNISLMSGEQFSFAHAAGCGSGFDFGPRIVIGNAEQKEGTGLFLEIGKKRDQLASATHLVRALGGELEALVRRV
jgi:hypothetical protein